MPRPHIPAWLRRRVMERDGGTCSIRAVGCTGDRNIHIDHIIPVAFGGGTDEDNLRVACRTCNLTRPNPANQARAAAARARRGGGKRPKPPIDAPSGGWG